VALEVVKRFLYVSIVLESRYNILKYYGHSMNILLILLYQIKKRK